MDIVHDVEMASTNGNETEECSNPLCDVRFQQTGLAIKPRRFCSDHCKQQASLIRRVAALFDGLPDTRVIEILKSKQNAT